MASILSRGVDFKQAGRLIFFWVECIASWNILEICVS